jgi:hypothetical protein
MNNCISLTAREFWLNEELISSCCCLFVGFENGTWIKAFYNDEILNWEIESLSEAPHLISEGDSEFYYPIRHYLNEQENKLGELIETKNHNRNSVELVFSSGSYILLGHDDETESNKIEVVLKA